MTKRTVGLLSTIASAVYFGLIPLFVKTVYEGGGNAFSVACYRFLLSLPFLFVYLKVKKVPMGITLEQFIKIFLITVFGYGGTTVLLFTAYNYIPSGMATTIHFTYPVFTILACIIFFKEKVNPTKILCAVLCMAGILLFYSGDGAINLFGMSMAFGSGMTYAFYTAWLGKSGLNEMDPLKLIFYMNSVATVMIFILAMSTGQFTIALTPKAWAVAIIFASATSFIGVLGYQIGVRNIGPESTSILSTFEPITSIIIGIIVYQEAFTLKLLLGCLCILVSVVLVARLKE